MSEIPARVWYDPHDGRLQVTIEGAHVQRRPDLRHANLRVEWSHGSWAESSISVPKKETTPARTRQADNLDERIEPYATTPTIEQVHAYLLAHEWERRPDDPAGKENWVHPTYGDGYPHSGITFRTAQVERDGWDRLDLEVFTI